jgi:MYXO-CTERM domain-containing protein
MRAAVTLLILVGLTGSGWAKKIYLNPSDQSTNPVAGGGNEAQYALVNAKLAKTILANAGYSAVVDQDFYNAPKNANSWGADIFISIHTNAGGGHGTETLYVSSGGKALADHVQKGLIAALPYQSRGLVQRSDLHVLNATNMYACLTECLFHDCSKTSGYAGHPPSEAAYLKSAAGQKAISQGIAAGACAYFGSTCGITPPPVATKGTLKGTVYKAPNLDDVIAGAAIKLSSGQTLKAGSNGQWSIELPAGDFTVTASAAGFTSASTKATVKVGAEVWATIGLKAAVVATPDASVEPALLDGQAVVGDSPAPRSTAAAPRGGDGGCACQVGADPATALPCLLVLAALLLVRPRKSR